MIKISEYVTLGHPDKIADYISQSILDEYIKQDKNTRYALEVQIKDNFVTLGGEITSMFDEVDIEAVVRKAVAEIGYDKEYQKIWGVQNVVCSDDLIIEKHISRQSDDICVGVSNQGWGDQGIMFGMAVYSPETNYMPLDIYMAKELGDFLYNSKIGGLDIKTQVVLKPKQLHFRSTIPEYDIDKIIVAIPLLDGDTSKIEEIVREKYKGNYQLIVNGTGQYIKHSSMGDCGTTGRKLAVDFYGGNCVIGGGSPWTKDGTKADLTLNMYARKKALEKIKERPDLGEITCCIACCIGQKEIDVFYRGKNMQSINPTKEIITPDDLIKEFELDIPIFAELCRNGLFSRIK